jgi:hypothetical protein
MTTFNNVIAGLMAILLALVLTGCVYTRGGSGVIYRTRTVQQGMQKCSAKDFKCRRVDMLLCYDGVLRWVPRKANAGNHQETTE